MVKNPPAMPEIQVRSLGSEGPLEEGTATHSSILAWRIPMDRGIWKATVHGVAKTQTWLKQLSMHAYIAVLSEPKNVGLSWLISWRILATLASKQTDKLACVKKNGNWEGRWRLKWTRTRKFPLNSSSYMTVCIQMINSRVDVKRWFLSSKKN